MSEGKGLEHEFQGKTSGSFGVLLTSGEMIDSWLYGKKLLIKTCKVWVANSRSPSGKRLGSFYLLRFQHEDLVLSDGFYGFCLYLPDGRVCGIRVLSARVVSGLIEDMKGTVISVPWVKVFPELENLVKGKG